MGIEFSPKAVIFDFDGSLGDSMWVWDNVDMEFARRRNLPFSKEDAESIAALGFEGTAAWMLERFGLDESVDDLIAEWYELAAESYAHEVQLKPGAKEYVEKLRQQGISVGIATSLRRDMLEPALHNNGVFDLMDAIVVCEEICDTGKATPAVYQEAARQMGAELSECIVFEDVALAARSAKRGGAYVVGVRDKHAQQILHELEEASELIVDDFRELL